MTERRRLPTVRGVFPTTDAKVTAASDPAGRLRHGRRGERHNECTDTNPCHPGLGPPATRDRTGGSAE